jgi:hypothetical protein
LTTWSIIPTRDARVKPGLGGNLWPLQATPQLQIFFIPHNDFDVFHIRLNTVPFNNHLPGGFYQRGKYAADMDQASRLYAKRNDP